MALFKNKPKLIEAERFDPAKTFPSHVLIRRFDGWWQIWNAARETWVNVRIGDMIRVDRKDDVYPIDIEEFHRTYEAVEK